MPLKVIRGCHAADPHTVKDTAKAEMREYGMKPVELSMTSLIFEPVHKSAKCPD